MKVYFEPRPTDKLSKKENAIVERRLVILSIVALGFAFLEILKYFS